MDIFSTLLIFVLTILIVSVIFWYVTIPSNLPPGPLGLPFIGSSLKTWKAEDAYEQLRKWVQQYGPVYKVYIGNKLVVVLGTWEAIQEALVKNGPAYNGRPSFNVIFPKEVAGMGVTGSEGEIWKTHRRFALSTLRDFGFGRPILEPRIKDEAENLLQIIDEHQGRPFDPARILSNAVSNVICALVFGRRFEHDNGEFHRLLDTIRTRLTQTNVSFLTPFVLVEQMATLLAYTPQVKFLKKTNTRIITFLKEQIKITIEQTDIDDNSEPTNYIEAFLRARKERGDTEEFSDGHLLANVGNLFFAGTDTTSTTLRWGIFLLAHNPEIQEKIYDEIRRETGGQSLLNYSDRSKLPYTEAAIMETQRLANLVPLGVMRKTVEPTKLYGYDIPVNTAVVPLLGASLMDPDIYNNPKEFDPSRYLNEGKKGGKKDVHTHLIPFSVGKRNCLGESLARMELFIFYTALVSTFKFYFPNDSPKPPMKAVQAFIHAPIPYEICAERRIN